MTLKQTEALISEMLEEKCEVPPEKEEEAEEKPFRKSSIGDMRLFTNSLSKLIDTLQNAGIDAHSRKYETENYIEYKVRITKQPPSTEKPTQLAMALRE